MENGKRPGDEVAPGTGQSGDAICPTCKGTGQIEAKNGSREDCDACGGTGKITALVGDS